ncbi:PhzF family phenazine biosynthesis protein [Paramicrobacterium agarici]|uniref:PhzF family phenazine biosynthesis protein n=1 Tax=Paramicrobacterium agarici TaxID=630514 RepID=UPI0011528BC4|nr:PhzF family phenazine biosynthesis protein [Microbacterium agarici]TQO22146.1 PhzF family phenazine biosynthesis protein [Microbacterium agarici]
MPKFAFSQVDVFSNGPFTGNPLAVVHDADTWTDADMATFARWTNLSETAFLLAPRDDRAHYRVRIFTPTRELPFAGHPTLGSAHAWIEAGGVPDGDVLVQDCEVGLVTLRREPTGLAFRAPELVRSGPIDSSTLNTAAAALGIDVEQVRRAEWIDNGPGWLGIMLDDAEMVLALQPDFARMGNLKVGVLGRHSDGTGDVEVRAFAPGFGIDEDPVTGSLNAGFAVWLTREGILPPAYTARQGSAIGRSGRVSITSDDTGIWVGGSSSTMISGNVHLGD